MKELFINEVISKTSYFLDNNQRIKLEEILTEICLNYHITIIEQTEKQETQKNNTDILNKFIAINVKNSHKKYITICFGSGLIL